MVKKFKMDNKKINILEEDWDYLVILDACRYDYFKEIYRDFFDKGKLKKAISPFTNTIEFLRGLFGNDYFEDIIYVSGNSFINSKIETSFGGLSFDGKKHFYKIVDVWDWGWSEKIGTVHPKKMNEAVLTTKKRNPNKKMIIHYVQPHIPYITLRRSEKNDFLKYRKYFIKLIETIRKKLKKLFKDTIILKKVEKIFSIPRWKKLTIKYSKSGVRKVYKRDLKLVLRYIKRLTLQIRGKCLITADHGEMLGENGKWGHGYKDKKCLEIPWFEINN